MKNLRILTCIFYTLLPLFGWATPAEPPTKSATMDVMLMPSNYNGYEISCSDANDGTIMAQVTGGMPPYDYQWSNGMMGIDMINSLSPGFYEVTVTDFDNTMVTQQIMLTAPDPIMLDISSTDESGTGLFDGTATVNVVSANSGSPYTYQWSNGANTNTITGLTQGSYDVTVTNVNGCEAITSVLVETGATCDLTVSIQETTPIVCMGESDGVLDAIPSGGQAPYTYNWDNGVNSASNFPLGPGLYQLTVTDQQGCTAEASYNLEEPLAIQLAFTNQDETYPGAEDGIIHLDITNGTSPYNIFYEYDGQPYPEGLVPNFYTKYNATEGQYNFVVTDANGCSASLNTNLGSGPCQLDVSFANYSNVTCYGGNDGAAYPVVMNGVAPFTYTWSPNANALPEDDTLTNLSAGFYDLMVTDSKGCMASTTLQITEPQGISTVISSTNETFGGATDGTAHVLAYGGVEPYTYNWDNGGTASTISGLSAGQYIVTVTDASGCTYSDFTFVNIDDINCDLEITMNITSAYNGSDVSCFDSNDGAVTATVIGGTAPYTYSWDNNQTNASVTNLYPGTYRVTVVDANFCEATAEVTLMPPLSLLVLVTATAETADGANDGTATALATGGTGNSTYQWSNSATSASISGLSSGIYTVTATDDNGCTQEATVVVDAAIPDSDSDGIVNTSDNCPYVSNPDQADSNGDGEGDACTCDPATADLVTTAGIHQAAYASHDGTWTHYCNHEGALMLSLAQDGTGASIPFDEVRLEIGASMTTYYGDSTGFVENGAGGVFMNRAWDVRPDVQPSSNVGVRFYFRQEEFESMNSELAVYNFTPIPNVTDIQFYKITNSSLGIFPALPSIEVSDIEFIVNGSTPGINTWTHGNHGTEDHYAEYEVYSFSGTGAPGTAPAGMALPVELTAYYGRIIEGEAHLFWATASEQNNLGWRIQRMEIDRTWSDIGFVEGAGDSETPLEYAFQDRATKSGTNYYRLVQMDLDGQLTYSNALSLLKEEGLVANQIEVFPNPTVSEITIVNESGPARIFNALGKQVASFTITDAVHTFDLGHLPAGMYHLECTGSHGVLRTTKFYKSEE